jgi:chromosome segregation ATPase
MQEKESVSLLSTEVKDTRDYVAELRRSLRDQEAVHDNEMREKETTNSVLSARLDAKQGRLDIMTRSISELKKALEAKETEYDALEAAKNEADRRVENLRETYELQRAQIEKNTQLLNRQNANMITVGRSYNEAHNRLLDVQGQLTDANLQISTTKRALEATELTVDSYMRRFGAVRVQLPVISVAHTRLHDATYRRDQVIAYNEMGMAIAKVESIVNPVLLNPPVQE